MGREAFVKVHCGLIVVLGFLFVWPHSCVDRLSNASRTSALCHEVVGDFCSVPRGGVKKKKKRERKRERKKKEKRKNRSRTDRAVCRQIGSLRSTTRW